MNQILEFTGPLPKRPVWLPDGSVYVQHSLWSIAVFSKLLKAVHVRSYDPGQVYTPYTFIQNMVQSRMVYI